MKAGIWILTIVLLWCGAAVADTIDAEGTANGTAVIWFSGTNTTATFEGTFSLIGRLMVAETAISFSASGWIRGAGAGDTSTSPMDVEGWATFAASGLTEAGAKIAIQGGLTLAGLSADAAGSAGSGTGDFVATIFIADQKYWAQGSAGGTVSGTFVVPEDPLSMELAGDGFFNLSGDMTLVSPATQETDSSAPNNPDFGNDSSVSELLPWDTETWPEELLSQLLDILLNMVEDPAATEGDSPPE